MALINVHTAFNLLLTGEQERRRFETGLVYVPKVVADHWYTKQHSDVVDADAEPKEVAAEEPAIAEEPEVQEQPEHEGPEEPEVASEADEVAEEVAALDHDAKDGPGGSVSVTSEQPFDDMGDDALRAFITERDGKAPHHKAGRPKLLAIARKEDGGEGDEA